MKTLRAHVAAALEHGLPTPEAMPLTVMVGDRISRDLVRQAIAHLLRRAGRAERAPAASWMAAEVYNASDWLAKFLRGARPRGSRSSR